MKIFITGTAGFIGFHLANELIKRGDEVVGFDNINDYYDINLKLARLKFVGFDVFEIEEYKMISSKTHPNLHFIKGDLTNEKELQNIFKNHKFDVVVNLAAQAGVRYSLINPKAYIDSNIVGFANLIECVRHSEILNFVYASSSSVYGLNENTPFKEENGANHPVSLYAATKKSNEMIAHSYSHLYQIPTTGLRFFTVYGPWGRPDMAYFMFVKAALKGETINVFNNGKMKRDFTYIDDIVKGVIKVIDKKAMSNLSWDAKNPNPASSKAPFKVYNIGNNNTIELMDFIEAIEEKLDIEMKKNFMPIQPGDVKETYADVSSLVRDFDYKPSTNIKDGVSKFVDWYLGFYKDSL